jgi:DNA-binding GntR family transcriptional regulator
MPKNAPKPVAATTTKAAPARRAADVAYEAIENLISTLQLAPGSPVVEADLVERTQLGRTPVREALLRMVSIGLVQQQPRRGLTVSTIDLADHLDVIQTRRVLECLLASCSARRATALQRQQIVAHADQMRKAAKKGNMADYMWADLMLDQVNHQASQNHSAVKAVVPLVVQCRRFWFAYQHAGDIEEGAQAHWDLAQGIGSGDSAAAVAGANRLADYLNAFARRVIDD